MRKIVVPSPYPLEHEIPLSLSVIFNNRQDITRPTRGWSVIAEVERVDRALESDYEYTRLSADVSYLWGVSHLLHMVFRLVQCGS
jgi:outer membrane protein assembly factor BamA